MIRAVLRGAGIAVLAVLAAALFIALVTVIVTTAGQPGG